MGICSVAIGDATLLRAGALADPCPFGYGCGGGKLDGATKAKMGSILEGVLKNLSNQEALVQGTQHVSKIESVGSTATVEAVSGKALDALHNISAALKKSADSAEAGRAIDDALTGFGRPLDARPKAKVASILEGVLKNLSSQK